MRCDRCGDTGTIPVADSAGERDLDVCGECDSWSKKTALSRRSQAASQALREAGIQCSMIRETIMVADPHRPGWAMDVVPLPIGGWLFTLRAGVEVSEVLAIAQIIINKF